MLYNLTKILDTKGYHYNLINLHRVEVQFIHCTVVFIITDNAYKIYVFDLNNDIIKQKDYKYAKCAIRYMILNA